jgi:hypothetical protein
MLQRTDRRLKMLGLLPYLSSFRIQINEDCHFRKQNFRQERLEQVIHCAGKIALGNM